MAPAKAYINTLTRLGSVYTNVHKLDLYSFRHIVILYSNLYIFILCINRYKKTNMKINTPKDLSAIIKDNRKAKGWTQADLAKRIGVYQRDISNCETKPEKISVDMLIKLCASLDLALKVDNLAMDEVSTQTSSLAKKSLRF